jgi:hypothetical protein
MSRGQGGIGRYSLILPWRPWRPLREITILLSTHCKQRGTILHSSFFIFPPPFRLLIFHSSFIIFHFPPALPPPHFSFFIHHFSFSPRPARIRHLTALCSRKAVPPCGSRYRVIFRAPS